MATATNGKYIPDDAPKSYTFNSDGTPNTITATWEGVSYVYTYTYSGGKISTESGWVQQ